MLLLLNKSAVQRLKTPEVPMGLWDNFFSGSSVQHAPGYHSRIIRLKNVQPT